MTGHRPQRSASQEIAATAGALVGVMLSRRMTVASL
jgi:hypothetical protein